MVRWAELPTSQAKGSPQTQQRSSEGRMPRNANALSNQAAQMAGPCAESAEASTSRAVCVSGNSFGTSRPGCVMRSSSSTMGAAEAASSMLSRSAALPATKRASLTISSERPWAKSTSACEYSSSRELNWLVGFRAPFATARICEPSCASKDRIRSDSPNLVFRSTSTRAL